MGKRAILFVVVLALLLDLFIDAYRTQFAHHIQRPSIASRSLDCPITSSTTVKCRESISSLQCTMMSHIYAKSRLDEKLGLSDFDLILDAIYTYKKVFGDTDIPIKFVVPAKEPWPEKLHDLRVGKRLEKLLTSQEFFDSHPDKVDAIKNLGLEPNVNALIDDWGMIRIALRQFKATYNSVRVPSKFVVPDTPEWPRLARGLKLGVRVAAIRSAGRYVKDHPYRKAELDDLGFEWRLREANTEINQANGADLFEQIMEGLQIYKDTVDASLTVPPDFIVPVAESWPATLHGFELGQLVSSIRDKDPLVSGNPEREERLSKLGFTWEENGRALFSKKRFDMVYSALLTYKQIYGDLFVPQAFLVPNSEPWPETTWGLKLGARVNAIRAQGTLVANAPDRREMLDQLGFPWELPSHIKREKKRRLEEENALLAGDPLALEKEYMKPGPKPTPYSLESRSDSVFLSGSGAKWPYDEDAELAERVANQNRISSLKLPGKLAGERRSMLEFDPHRMFEPSAYREVAAEALGIYMRGQEMSSDPDIRQWAHFDGHLNPEKFHNTISRSIPEEDIKWMKRVGYRILEFGRFDWDDFAEALVIYHKHHGDVNVPHEYVIDDEKIGMDIGFTERMEDLKLGEAVLGIRTGDIDGLEDTIRRKFLDSLGFDWGDKSKHQRYRFVPMLLGLKVYKHLYGFPLPQYDFVVPDEPQWPYWMAKMPLGEWAAVARVQQKMIEQHYPERVDMLTALEFMWWVPPGPIAAKWHRPVR